MENSRLGSSPRVMENDFTELPNRAEGPPTPLPLGLMLANLARTHAMRVDQAMDKIGLYRGQAILLIILAEQDGLIHSEIAGRLCISPAAASKVIKRMEELGYVQRTPDPVDERLSRVFLLEHGRAKLDDIHTVFRSINARLVREFSPQEQVVLQNFLSRMITNLQDG